MKKFVDDEEDDDNWDMDDDDLDNMDIGKKKKEAIAALQVGVREGAGAVVPLRGFRAGLREGATPDLHLQPGVGTHRSLATDRLIASELRTLL